MEVDGRCVLDIAADPLDSSLAMITVEPEGLSSSTRIYDIGRRRVQARPLLTSQPHPSLLLRLPWVEILRLLLLGILRTCAICEMKIAFGKLQMQRPGNDS